MADIKAAYAASASVTATGLASLASSSTLVAGYSLAEIDNTSNKYCDYEAALKATAGTTPTANTQGEWWVIPKKDDSSYHDTFDGTAKAVTVTSREMLAAYGFPLKTSAVPVATSNIGYEAHANVASACGKQVAPHKFQFFFVHNMVAALNSNGGNHVVTIKGEYATAA